MVDSVSCDCLVDSSLRTVVGARKFIPGAKICIQPVQGKHSCGRSSMVQPPFLPGLPDDVAISCLIRVPRVEHNKLRSVCKRWFKLLASDFFYSLRKSLGMAEEWVYIIRRDCDGNLSWHAYDPTYQLWKTLPPIPGDYNATHGFGCAVLSGCCLYLFGGKDPLRGSMRRVVLYSARTNKWHWAPNMIQKRHFSGSCVINNRIYVAGGECEEGIKRTLGSVEVYDPNRNRWSSITDMRAPMMPFSGVVYNGKWFLKGLGASQEVLSEAYSPETNTWGPVNDGLDSSMRNPIISMNGKLCASCCRNGCGLRVYDDGTVSLKRFSDSKLRFGIAHPPEDASLISLNGRLCIIHNYVASKGSDPTFSNLWCSIAGCRSTSEIVHCQVLEA